MNPCAAAQLILRRPTPKGGVSSLHLFGDLKAAEINHSVRCLVIVCTKIHVQNAHKRKHEYVLGLRFRHLFRQLRVPAMASCARTPVWFFLMSQTRFVNSTAVMSSQETRPCCRIGPTPGVHSAWSQAAQCIDPVERCTVSIYNVHAQGPLTRT